MEDRLIINLYNSRDERAIAETRDKYGTYCMAIAYRILSNQEDSEECVSDTWLRTWNAIPPEQPFSLRAYLGTITRNLSFDRYRQKHRKKREGCEIEIALEEIAHVIPSSDNPQTEYDANELADCINRFLATLNQRDRNLMLCRYYFVYPTSKIAECYGIGENQAAHLILSLIIIYYHLSCHIL